ncbi:MAG: DUF2621 family protein [Myxococcales bacterium]|nr:DUF2621 family protein [Myxococcales bacterium]
MVTVQNLDRAERFWVEQLGFQVKVRGEGWLDIDVHTCVIRLSKVRRVEHPVTLRLQVENVESAVKELTTLGARLQYEPHRTAAQELLAAVQDPDGHTLLVWRPLSEDEYDHTPALPKELTWSPEAEELLQALLRSVPSLFRALARWRVSKNAEFLAESTRVVQREHVIRAFILSSAKVTRYRNRQPLIDQGIDVSRYEADFASDDRL